MRGGEGGSGYNIFFPDFFLFIYLSSGVFRIGLCGNTHIGHKIRFWRHSGSFKKRQCHAHTAVGMKYGLWNCARWLPAWKRQRRGAGEGCFARFKVYEFWRGAFEGIWIQWECEGGRGVVFLLVLVKTEFKYWKLGIVCKYNY